MVGKIRNRVVEIGAQARTRPESDIDTIMVHRCGVGESAIEIASWYANYPPIGIMPYHFVILANGAIEQALLPTAIGPHAWRWNPRSIGIACVGDFTKDRPTADQNESLRWLCRMLELAYYTQRQFHRSPDLIAYSIVGHTDVPMSTKEHGKICPGQYLPVENLRQVVVGDIKSAARQELISAGMTF